LEYLDGNCQLQPIKADSTPILLGPATIGIIDQTLKEKKEKIEVYEMRQLMDELAKPRNTEKQVQLFEKMIEKRKWQLEYIEDLQQHLRRNSDQNATFDLRSMGRGKEKSGIALYNNYF
jgi:hypothetical protein